MFVPVCECEYVHMRVRSICFSSSSWFSFFSILNRLEFIAWIAGYKCLHEREQGRTRIERKYASKKERNKKKTFIKNDLRSFMIRSMNVCCCVCVVIFFLRLQVQLAHICFALLFINITLFCVCVRVLSRFAHNSFFDLSSTRPWLIILRYSCIFIFVFSFHRAKHTHSSMNNDVYTLYIQNWLNAECAKKIF